MGKYPTIKIETYWNVNIFIPPYENVILMIKIETYWNVNKCPALPLVRQTVLK